MVDDYKKRNGPDGVEVDLSPTEARHSERGRPVLLILGGGLILAALVWGAVELWAPGSEDPGVNTVNENVDTEQPATTQ